jgi:hypothetical protein
MVIRGRIRGNGRQLGQYLLTKGENDRIEILDVCGRDKAKDHHLHEALFAMNITAELTKTDKGLYHAQINPAYGDDQKMTETQWHRAADVLAAELKLSDQRRVIVLHTKKGRTHAHVVWERYDHEGGKMIDNKFSRLAQDRARQVMEKIFEHTKTPERNTQRQAIKQTLSELWRQNTGGKDFIAAAKQNNYTVAAGERSRPFMVVDESGRSFDLVRQLNGVKTKDVRGQLHGIKLPSEKAAITAIRDRQQKRQGVIEQMQKSKQKNKEKERD